MYEHPSLLLFGRLKAHAQEPSVIDNLSLSSPLHKFPVSYAHIGTTLA